MVSSGPGAPNTFAPTDRAPGPDSRDYPDPHTPCALCGAARPEHEADHAFQRARAPSHVHRPPWPHTPPKALPKRPAPPTTKPEPYEGWAGSDEEH